MRDEDRQVDALIIEELLDDGDGQAQPSVPALVAVQPLHHTHRREGYGSVAAFDDVWRCREIETPGQRPTPYGTGWPGGDRLTEVRG